MTESDMSPDRELVAEILVDLTDPNEPESAARPYFTVGKAALIRRFFPDVLAKLQDGMSPFPTGEGPGRWMERLRWEREVQTRVDHLFHNLGDYEAFWTLQIFMDAGHSEVRRVPVKTIVGDGQDPEEAVQLWTVAEQELAAVAAQDDEIKLSYRLFMTYRESANSTPWIELDSWTAPDRSF